MNRSRPIKVLIVDDSLLYREVLSRGLSSDPSIQVVGTAVDPFDARDKIERLEPDVMTCDIEMPRMNGIEFIRRLMPQYPMPIIVVSSLSQAVFDAMNAGAVDFVNKPDTSSVHEVERFIRDMIHKVKVAVGTNFRHKHVVDKQDVVKIEGNLGAPNDLIVIGASTGGTEAIYRLLSDLPPRIPGILIVQHIPPDFSRMFAERMNHTTHFEVKEAESGDIPERGKVLIAPGDKHMRLIRTGSRYVIECAAGEKVSGHCPSVDVLFESVAKAAGPRVISVILTGMGYDGTKGMLAIRRKGGRTIGQDASSSVVYGMPKAAFEIGAVEFQLPLNKISAKICSLLG